MRTTFDCIDILYQKIKNSTVVNVISGKVYKNTRPLNSRTEDIVIGSLPINNEDIQQTVLNVNIHVPNLKLSIDGNIDNSQANFVRLQDLTELVIQQIDDITNVDYWYNVQQQTIFEDLEEHYTNIRVNFYSENFKY